MDIKEQVKGVIVNMLKVKTGEIKDGMSLENSIGVDSTEMVELVIALGKSFNIKIGEKEITKFSTLDEIEKVIAIKIGK